ncbi:molybdopterin-dependent oxidoreductase [Deinococcus sp. UYEF24]
MFLNNPPSNRRSPNRLRLALLALLLLVGVGAALWWNGRPAPPEDFTYVHGSLAPVPAAEPGGTDGNSGDPANQAESDQDTVFELRGPVGRRRFTAAQLQALPAVQYRATQPQLRQSVLYTGVPLRDLARLAGLDGRPLRIEADDQFGATIEPEDYQAFPVMLAYLADGQPITTAQKGPFEVVFPNEQHQKRFQGNGSRWVWFATTLTVAP